MEIEPHLPGVYCETSKIIQSILNILRFVIRNFNPKLTSSSVIGITAYRENSKINIEIKDNGPIIPLNDLDLNLANYNMTSNNYWYYIALSDYIIRNSLNGELILDVSNGNSYKILLY